MAFVTTANLPQLPSVDGGVQGKTITISRNRVELNRLQFDGKQLVDPEGAPIRGPYVRESK